MFIWLERSTKQIFGNARPGKDSSGVICVHAARNSFAAAQIVVRNLEPFTVEKIEVRRNGGKAIRGGEVDGANDHRIVMSAAVAALACTGAVTIHGAQAVSKSYPDFFDDYFGRK